MNENKKKKNWFHKLLVAFRQIKINETAEIEASYQHFFFLFLLTKKQFEGFLRSFFKHWTFFSLLKFHNNRAVPVKPATSNNLLMGKILCLLLCSIQNWLIYIVSRLFLCFSLFYRFSRGDCHYFFCPCLNAAGIFHLFTTNRARFSDETYFGVNSVEIHQAKKTEEKIKTIESWKCDFPLGFTNGKWELFYFAILQDGGGKSTRVLINTWIFSHCWSNTVIALNPVENCAMPIHSRCL